MNKLKELKKYFKDSRLERAFIKLLVQVDLYERPLAIALSNLTEGEIIGLKLFYKCYNYDTLIEKLQNDITYILEG